MSRTHRRILVVDDNEPNRALARAALEDEGYEVLAAPGGVRGLEVFEAEHPDCVLLDVRMPDLDGPAVCERIRAMPDGRQTPILFFTALRDLESFDRARRAGGDDFLTKPVRPSELVHRVQSALELRRLSSEVREQYDSLKRQRDDLLRLQLQKERLIAFVVHDLKNPLNSIDLQAQVLLRERGLSPRALEVGARIRVDARQLNRMIMNLLDVSRADEGRLVPNPTNLDLPRLVSEVIEENSAYAQERKVTLRSESSVDRLRADEDLFRRTLTNLVENAIRHSPAGGDVVVRTVAAESVTDVQVRDSGAGIPPEMRDRVFEPFVRLASPNSNAEARSRGLGLTFCKLAVEAHGGSIWIEDASPGAAFCMRFRDVA